MNTHETLVPLAFVLNDALSPLESFADILAAGGHEDMAVVIESLLRDTRAQLHAVARCLEIGCGRKLMLREMDGKLYPVACAWKKKPCRANGKAASPD